MSIKVELADLQTAAAGFPFAYFLTVGDDGRPHAVAISPSWSAQTGAMVLDVGRRTVSNATLRTKVSVIWPPSEAGGYSLIVDGDSSIDDAGLVVVTPTSAVLHRPAP